MNRARRVDLLTSLEECSHRRFIFKPVAWLTEPVAHLSIWLGAGFGPCANWRTSCVVAMTSDVVGKTGAL